MPVQEGLSEMPITIRMSFRLLLLVVYSLHFAAYSGTYIVGEQDVLPGLDGKLMNELLAVKYSANAVFAWESTTNDIRPLWESDIQIVTWVENKNGLVAIVDSHDLQTGVGKFHDYDIHVVDGAGNLVKTLGVGTRVCSLSWSPDGEELAFTGFKDPDFNNPEYYDEYYGPRALFIHNIARNETKVLAEGRFYMVWAAFDNRIYMCDEGEDALCVNPSTGEVQQTEFKDIWFSSSGEWYFRGPERHEGDIVYRTEGNSFVGGDEESLFAPIIWQALQAHMWLDGSRLLLFQRNWLRITHEGKHSYVLDVSSGELRRTASLIIREASKSGEYVTITLDGQLQIESLLDMKIVVPGDLRELLPKYWKNN